MFPRSFAACKSMLLLNSHIHYTALVIGILGSALRSSSYTYILSYFIRYTSIYDDQGRSNNCASNITLNHQNLSLEVGVSLVLALSYIIRWTFLVLITALLKFFYELLIQLKFRRTVVGPPLGWYPPRPSLPRVKL